MSDYSETVIIPERRQKPRIKCDYPAEIRGHDVNGKLFKVEGRAINLSRNGVYIRLNQEIPNGMELSIGIAIPTGFLELGTSKLALHGTVVRGRSHSDSIYEIAVIFQGYRFI